MGSDSLLQKSVKECYYKSIQEAYWRSMHIFLLLEQLWQEVVKFGKNLSPLSTCLLTNEIRLFAIKLGTVLRWDALRELISGRYFTEW